MGGYMGQTYHKLYYHAIGRTHLSEPNITPEIEKVLYPFLKNKAKRFHCEIIEGNGTKDHVHFAIRIPPSIAVSDIIGKLKGSSSYFLNKELHLPGILEYIRNQKQHHTECDLKDRMERFDPEVSDA